MGSFIQQTLIASPLRLSTIQDTTQKRRSIKIPSVLDRKSFWERQSEQINR
jgi:hypothetical protein